MEQGTIARFSQRMPLGIIVPMLLIVAIGVLNLSSAAQATRPDLYLHQLSKFAIASSIMVLIALVHTRVIRRVSFFSFAFALGLLALVLLVGTSAKGAQRWLVLGAFRLQPSDPAKIALVLALARYCSQTWPQKGYTLYTLVRPLNFSRPLGFLGAIVLVLVMGRHGSAIFSEQFLASKLGMLIMVSLLLLGLAWFILALGLLKRDGFALSSFVAPVDIAILPFLLIALEPDLATGLLLLGISGVMFLYVGIRKSSVFLGLIIAVCMSVFAYSFLLKDYQQQRIVSFLNQEADVQGQGYQAMQSIIAIGSGRITGKGFLGGTQTQLSFLPENATDFVFSVWAEEWGFVASVFLLFLYFLLLLSILRLSTKVDDKFSKLICVGIAANIFMHVMVNVAMVTGLLPVAGVPLLLMSYGGSAMVTTLIGIGLVCNVALWRGAK